MNLMPISYDFKLFTFSGWRSHHELQNPQCAHITLASSLTCSTGAQFRTLCTLQKLYKIPLLPLPLHFPRYNGEPRQLFVFSPSPSSPNPNRRWNRTRRRRKALGTDPR